MTCNLKRMLSLLMVFVVLLTICPTDSIAADTNRVTVGYGQMQNPLYPELPKEHLQVSSASVQSVLGDGTYVSQQEAVLLIRDAMIARETSFTVNIFAPDGPPDIKYDLFPAVYSMDVAEGLYDGDYLRWSWKNVAWQYSYSGSNYSYNFTLTYYTTATQEQLLQSAVEDALEELDTANKTDYQKLCSIYDYISSCADYDYDALDRVKNSTATQEDYLIFTAYGAMLRGNAVCQGYACLLYAMCRSAGVPVRIIHNSIHAWNIAKIGDLWYNLDVTWDGQDSENRTNYFLKGSGNFLNHTPNAEFSTASFQTSYPISESDYTLGGQDSCYPHAFDGGVVGIPACTQTGTRIYTCEKCGFSKSVSVAQSGHRHQKYQKDATCTEKGSVYYTCVFCGDTYEEESIPELGHKYKDTVVKPTCTSGGYTMHSCVRCGINTTDNETDALEHSWDDGTIKRESTETSEGEKIYTCTLCAATKTEPIPKKAETPEHTYDEGTITKAPTCKATGLKTYTCTCGCGRSYTIELPMTDHIWNSGEVTTDPTTEADGVRTYTCTVCGDTKTESIAQVRHHFDQGTVVIEATCGTTGMIRYTCTDQDCEYSYTEPLSIDESNHRHHQQRQEATCTKSGCVIAVCEYCGDWYEVEVLPALGHDYETTRKEPTCTTSGEKVEVCSRCGDRKVETLGATGHNYTKTVVDPTCTSIGYTVYTCQNCGDSYQTDEQSKLPHDYRRGIVRPTCTEKGCTEYVCLSCGDRYETDPVPALGHSYGAGVATQYASSQQTGTTTYTCERCGSEKRETVPKLKNPFSDVKAGRYYYESVLWAANYDITKGITATTFEPDTTCTRAQVVTFLWRAAGAPSAINRTCGFTDVKKGTFYYEAMLWAVEQGITNGVTADTFCPEEPCSRDQVVTFLWRAAGEPGVSQRTHSFTDVKEGKFYYEAMLWAAEQGITIGDNSTTIFNPEGECTRGQVVTFLCRSRDLLNQ